MVGTYYGPAGHRVRDVSSAFITLQDESCSYARLPFALWLFAGNAHPPLCPYARMPS